MANNKLTNLNDHLFAQLERLNDENISPEEMKLEIEKAKAMEGISKSIIDTSKVVLESASLQFKFREAGYTEKEIPFLENRS